MPISHDHRAIFVHIPKNGGTSIETGLSMRMRDGDELWGFEDGNGVKYDNPTGIRLLVEGRSDLVCLQHLTSSQIRDRYPDEVWRSYFTFAFVRNPFDRVVSLYSYIVQKREDLQVRLGLTADTSFEEFLVTRKKMTQQREYVVDEDGQVIVDFIGRYEDLDRDYARVCREIGVDAPIPHLNRSKRRPYREYYDARTRAVAEQLFEEDLRQFDYTY